MRELNNEELMSIDGGAKITATLLSAVAKLISTIMDIGRSLGTSIMRLYSGTACTS